LIVIVTFAAEQDEPLPGALPWQLGEMLVTLPTLTPAIRTSDCGRSSFAFGTIAWIV
jgi:hypothetical protein